VVPFEKGLPRQRRPTALGQVGSFFGRVCRTSGFWRRGENECHRIQRTKWWWRKGLGRLAMWRAPIDGFRRTFAPAEGDLAVRPRRFRRRIGRRPAETFWAIAALCCSGSALPRDPRNCLKVAVVFGRTSRVFGWAWVLVIFRNSRPEAPSSLTRWTSACGALKLRRIHPVGDIPIAWGSGLRIQGNTVRLGLVVVTAPERASPGRWARALGLF